MKKSDFFLLLCLSLIQQTQLSGQVIHIKEVYKTVDTTRLKIDIFFEERSFERYNNTAIVFFHGGGWSGGSSSEFFTTCERYAKMGIVAFSVEYRLSSDNGLFSHNPVSPIECMMDAKSAIRWVRENAGKFHIDPNRIVAAGQSAGGQLVLATAMIEQYCEKSDNLKTSCKPDAVLLFSACVNTLEGWCDRLLADRRDKIWSISPTHNMKSGLPPMIDFHGTEDEQVPVWTARSFESEMKKLGNYFELHLYDRRKHYLGDGNLKYSNYYDDEILDIADEFLRNFHFLK
jgi:acetyl esterase/lipase